MATRRFSKEELYSLRNDIPIDKVIKHALDIPCRISEGSFRFLCPLCNNFNTAVNPATNLARCFCCKKNLNTIDLVMTITQSSFVNSIRFLKEFQRKLAKLNFLDPACGCGNFLVIAYRELRRLELKVLNLLYDFENREKELNLGELAKLSQVDVDQFYNTDRYRPRYSTFEMKPVFIMTSEG